VIPTYACCADLNLGGRTATGKAAEKGSAAAVNGYMAFLLFSVAGLACTS
jgi:hypothetical protein